MIAYLDSSVVLRAVFGEPGAFAAWSTLQYAITSHLTRIECLRRMDRRRVREAATEAELAVVRGSILELLSGTAIVPMTAAILDRAANPFPTSLGSLDAIHLATAIAWRDATADVPVFLTHDGELATAAVACGFEVRGASPPWAPG